MANRVLSGWLEPRLSPARFGLFIFVMVGLWALPASIARADLQAGCTQSGMTVTCSYTTQGQQASFAVPDDVTSLAVFAVGGTGGWIGTVRRLFGARSAIVAGNLGVAPGSVLDPGGR